jgi:hypothetical protein
MEPSGNDFQDLCTVLGVMTLTWAWGENALANAIGIIDESMPQVRTQKYQSL